MYMGDEAFVAFFDEATRADGTPWDIDLGEPFSGDLPPIVEAALLRGNDRLAVVGFPLDIAGEGNEV